MQSARILVATSESAARLMGPSTSIMKWFSSQRATVSTSRAARRRISPMRDSAAPRFWSPGSSWLGAWLSQCSISTPQADFCRRRAAASAAAGLR
jgi:hypothetical protein